MFLKTKNNEIWKMLIGFINLRVMGDFGERCFGGAIRAKPDWREWEGRKLRGHHKSLVV